MNFLQKAYLIYKKRKSKKLKKDFEGVKITDDETKKIINSVYKEHQFIIDPHTATGFGAAQRIKKSW